MGGSRLTHVGRMGFTSLRCRLASPNQARRGLLHMSRCDVRAASASRRRGGGLHARPPGLARLVVADQLSSDRGKPQIETVDVPNSENVCNLANMSNPHVDPRLPASPPDSLPCPEFCKLCATKCHARPAQRLQKKLAHLSTGDIRRRWRSQFDYRTGLFPQFLLGFGPSQSSSTPPFAKSLW